MNILFYRYGSICEPDILEVFRKMGFGIYEHTLEISEKDLPVEKKLESVSAILCEHNVDFIFSINYFPFLSALCDRLNLLYVCFSVDCPVLELFSNTIHNRCNRIFLFDYVQYETFHPQNPDCIFYLPLATNIDRWQSVLAGLSKDELSSYQNDISFVGSLYHEKSPLSILNKDTGLSDFDTGYMNGLIEAQLKVYGSDFLEDAVSADWVSHVKQLFPDFLTLSDAFTDTDRYVAANYYLGMRASETERVRILNKLAEQFPVSLYTRSDTRLLKNVVCRGGVTTHTQMPAVFYGSKINLNITIKSIQSGLSLRIWDILGCGGFLLSNYQAEIPEYFEIGKDLDCYESIPDLINKVSYYLNHDDIRMEIAGNGYRKVKAMHTWEHRIAAMMQTLFC